MCKRPTPTENPNKGNLNVTLLWGWPTDRVIALAALAVAFCSMLVSYRQFDAARTQQRLNAQPRFTYTFFWDETGAGWKIFNSGLGPARLRGFRILIDGKPVTDFREVGTALGLPQPVPFRFTNPMVGERWAAGHENILYWVAPGPAEAALRQQWTRVNIQACYCSLYGECWLFSSDGKFSSPDGEHLRDDNCSIFSDQQRNRWWGG
ncbi:MAG: hypothetical protein WAN11_02775 [Syntrophobacteraceae bacterium]